MIYSCPVIKTCISIDKLIAVLNSSKHQTSDQIRILTKKVKEKLLYSGPQGDGAVAPTIFWRGR